MKTTLRRLLVGALFALVGALSIDGTGHAQAGCSTPDPFAALGGGTCYRGGWFPPGMAIPDGGSASPASPAPPLHASAVVDMRHAGSVRGARRRDLLSRRLVPAGHADPERPRCDHVLA